MAIFRNFSTLLFSLIVVAVLAIGWQQRNEYWLTAEKGWGYALGIIGGSLMLVLLLYPVRKHWKFARNWFSIRYWFKMHMIFGIIGPVLILFHSNFQLGSLNSNIALFSMLLVSSSGLIGRYAYQKTHKGLYGEQIQFSELKHSFEESKSIFENGNLLAVATKNKISEIEKDIVRHNVPFFIALNGYYRAKKIHRHVLLGSQKEIKRILKNPAELKAFTQEMKPLLAGLNRLKKMANYALYARVFSIWHVFHLPIFFMMIIAGIVHVFAVHIY